MKRRSVAVVLLLILAIVFPVLPVGSVSVSPLAPLTLTVTGPTSGRVGTQENFTATASGGNTTVPYTFSWNFGDGTGDFAPYSINPDLLNHTYSVKGTHTVNVNVTDGSGALQSASTTITIAPLTLTVTVGPTAGEVDISVSFTATARGGTSPYNLSWNFGDGTGNVVGTSSTVSHTYTTPGTFTVKVNATDANAAIASVSETFHAYPHSVVGIDCAYGSQVETPGSTFPTSVTTSAPYAGPDFDGTLDSSCEATYLYDTDGALHPLVSDNPPTAVVGVGAGGGLTVDVVASLNPVTTINGFDISLKYDAKFLNGVSIDQSGLIWGAPCTTCPALPPGAFILNIAKTIDRLNGVVRVSQVLVGAPQLGGDVELFRIRFDVVGGSTGSPITFSSDPTRNVLTNPGPVVHNTINLNAPGVDTTTIYNTLNMGTALNAVTSWNFSPNPEVPASRLNFNATATCPGCTGPLTYTWDFTSQDTPGYTLKQDSTGAMVSVIAPPPVINRVTLNVTDSAHHSFLAVRRLPLTASATGTDTLAQGSSGGSWNVKWLGGVATALSGYTGTWTFCPGTALNKAVCSRPAVIFSQTGASINQTSSVGPITYNFAGVYNNTIKVSDTAEGQTGSFANSAIVFLLTNVTGTLRAFTVAVSLGTSSPAVGKAVGLTATVAYDPSYPSAFQSSSFNYVFDFGDGSSATTVSGGKTGTATRTYSSAGTFLVKVVAQETDFRARSMIQETGFLALSISPAAPSLCPVLGTCGFSIPASATAGQSVTLTATASGGSSPYTYSWSFGDGSTGTGATAQHTYSSAGTYAVVLTITDSAGQTQTISKSLTVGEGGSLSTLASPFVLAAIAAAIILIPVLVYLSRRGKKLAR